MFEEIRRTVMVYFEKALQPAKLSYASQLPEELLISIFFQLSSPRDLQSCALVSKKWYRTSNDNAFWTHWTRQEGFFVHPSDKLVKDSFYKELLEIERNYPSFIKKALGGPRNILKFPVLTSEKIQNSKELEIKFFNQAEITAPIMRGKHQDRHFLLYCIAAESKDKKGHFFVLYQGMKERELQGPTFRLDVFENNFLPDSYCGIESDDFIKHMELGGFDPKFTNLFGELMINKTVERDGFMLSLAAPGTLVVNATSV